MLVAGIDPGKSGGLAFIDTDTGEGWGELIDTTDVVTLRAALTAAPPGMVGVEVPIGRPPRTGGWKQIKEQWRAIGCAEATALALRLPLTRLTPGAWQKVAFAGTAKPAEYGARKKLALRLARERWPMASLARAKDSGVADALWIAWATACHHFRVKAG